MSNVVQIPEKWLYPFGPNGGRVYEKPGASAEYYEFVFKSLTIPGYFHRNIRIMDEDTQEFHATEPTIAQEQADAATILYRKVIAWKYRQAYFSTTGCNIMLRECMYLEGVTGIIISATDLVAQELLLRINNTYQALPDELKVPLATGRDAGSKKELAFAHGGRILVLSAEGKTPGISFSPSRVMISEAGEMDEGTIEELFRLLGPSIDKKKGAMIFIESTPGRKNGFYYKRCMAALLGESEFFPMFPKWWKDKNTQRPVTTPLRLTATEERLKQQYGLIDENIAFRRHMIATWFNGKEDRFDWAYPSSPISGWKPTGENPSLPAEVFDPLVSRTFRDNEVPIGPSGAHEREPPDATSHYLVVMDPKGWGVSHEWAISVFRYNDAECRVAGRLSIREVAWRRGKSDPNQQTDALVEVASRYIGARCVVVVESNHAGVMADLTRYVLEHPEWKPHVYGLHNKGSPGWYSTGHAKKEAVQNYVAAVRSGAMKLAQLVAVEQALRWNQAEGWKTGKDSRGTEHHFDTLITHFIAADVAREYGWVVERGGAEEQRSQEPKRTTPMGLEIQEEGDNAYSISERMMEERIAGRGGIGLTGIRKRRW